MNTSDRVITSTETITSWVKLYSNTMYTWAYFKTSNKESAEDLVQETFLAAQLNLEKFKGESAPKTWLLGILNNKISDYYRKLYRNPVNQNQDREVLEETSAIKPTFDENDSWAITEKPFEWYANESQLLDNTEFNLVLNACISQLPQHWGLALQLKYIEEKKGEVICQELNIAPTNFWQILHRAKLQLRKCLETNWFKS